MRRADDATIARVLLMRRNGLTWRRISERTGLSIPTCVRYYHAGLRQAFESSIQPKDKGDEK